MIFISFQLNMDDWVEFIDNIDNWNLYFIICSGLVFLFIVYLIGCGQFGVKVKVYIGRIGLGFIVIYIMVLVVGQVKYFGYIM